MRRMLFLPVLILFSSLALFPLACNQMGPTNPDAGTPTPTAQATPTGTLSAPCQGAADITAYLGKTDYVGSDAGKMLAGTLNLDRGGTNVGDVLTFTLSFGVTLNFSLCPTEQVGREMVLYVRSSCASPAGELFNDGYCDGLPQVTGAYLPAGTYYVILAEKPGSAAAAGGAYTLRVKAGDLSSPVCLPNPGAAPESIPKASFNSCLDYYELNGLPPNGHFGSPFNGIRAATGVLDESGLMAGTDDFVSFTPASSGPVTVILDCFDNGLNDRDFDVYCATRCPVDGTDPPVVAMSNSLEPVEQFSFNVTAGKTYYLDVQAYQGAGPYHLVVWTP